MGKVVITEFITLDGVVEDPGGAEDFERGGWAFKFDRGDAGDKFKSDELMASDAMLLGRRTYEGFAEAWPSRTGEFADRFNALPKYVASTTLKNPEWQNTTVIDGDLATAVSELKEKLDGDIVVHGSVELSRALIAEGLVDELRLMVFPTVLGAGKRLFTETPDAAAYRLTDSQVAGDTQILVYVPA
jgi:dihydrofolate reductase